MFSGLWGWHLHCPVLFFVLRDLALYSSRGDQSGDVKPVPRWNACTYARSALKNPKQNDIITISKHNITQSSSPFINLPMLEVIALFSRTLQDFIWTFHKCPIWYKQRVSCIGCFLENLHFFWLCCYHDSQLLYSLNSVIYYPLK